MILLVDDDESAEGTHEAFFGGSTLSDKMISEQKPYERPTLSEGSLRPDGFHPIDPNEALVCVSESDSPAATPAPPKYSSTHRPDEFETRSRPRRLRRGRRRIFGDRAGSGVASPA